MTDSSLTVAAQNGRDRMRHLRLYLDARRRQLDQRGGLSHGWLTAIFFLAVLAIYSRDISLFSHPQFWAEDGRDWYAQAYNLGWVHSLGIPHAGYLNIVQRIGAGLALLVPFRLAPLVMACWGLLLQAVPVAILLSSRCSRWAPLTARLAFAAVYIAIPNAHEIHVVCTNTQWHLALAELLLAFAAPPRTVIGRVFDLTVFALGTVSGPFTLLLVPFMLFFWWLRRERWSLVIFAVIALGSVAQLLVAKENAAQREIPGALGATWRLFIRLVGGDVFIGALLGSRPFGLTEPFVINFLAFIVAITLCVYWWRSAPLEIRLFCVYCAVVLVVALRNPLTSPMIPKWLMLLNEPSLRYWFFPSLPFLFAILWCVLYARNRVIRATSAVLTLVLCAGICMDWFIKPLEPLDFPAKAAQFEALPPGEHMAIPLNPIGWQMDLVKRSP